jgi:nucleoside-diphosphate-sugar epimerase
MIQAVIPGTEISFVDNKIMNQLSYEVANRKFCDLGFEFKGRLEIGIQETLQWLRGGNAA